MASGLAALAPLAGILKGIGGATEIQSQQAEMDRRRQLMALAQLQEQRESQQFQQQQNMGNLAGGALGAIPDIRQQLLSGMQQQQPQQSPMQPMPQQAGGGPGAVRGSWFGNAPGWNDPNDSGLQASGKPVSAGPGIALPSRATLGQDFDVTAPSGQTMRLPQTDIGPAKWTGRGVDINAPAAQAMGYSPGNFPTDKTFIVKAANQAIGQTAVGQAQAGAPMPLVKGAAGVSRQALGEIDPAQYGQATSDAIIKAVEKAGPNASGMEKLMAVQQLQKLMLPEERMQMQMFMRQNQDDIRLAIAGMQSGSRAVTEAEAARHNKVMEGIAGGKLEQGGTIFETHDPNNPFARVAPSGTVYPVQLPQGATKPSGGGGSAARSGQAAAVQAYIQEGKDQGAPRTSEQIRDFAAQTAAQMSATRAFDVAKQGDTVRSLNVAIDHLDTFAGTASALKNGNFTPWNAAVNALAKASGKPEPTNFDAAKTIVRDELLKAVLGSAGALGDRDELDKTMGRANSPEQLAEVVEIYHGLMGGQMRGLEKQFTSSGVGDEAAFQKKLLPRTQQALSRVRAHDTAGQSIDWSNMSDDELIKRARESGQ